MASVLIALASLWATPAPALAQEVQAAARAATTDAHPGQLCTARLPAGISLEQGRSWQADWRCDGSIPALGPGRIAVLLGEARNGEAHLQSRTGYFEDLIVLAVEGGRIMRTQRYDADTIPVALTDVGFTVALPAPDPATSGAAGAPDTARYIAVFENAEFPTTIAQARLVAKPINDRSGALAHLVVIAMMMGFLLLPVIFDLAFFRPLRQGFLLWHAALALTMAWHLSTSGLLAAFIPFSVNAMNDQAIASFGAVIACAILFATRFIEADKQDPRLRRAMIAWTGVILVITSLRMARLDAFTPFSAQVYFALFLPLLVMVSMFIGIAIRRGSRAVWFQIAAWLPFYLLGLVRIATMLFDAASYIEVVWLFRLGAVTEVAVTALGIVDRVIQIKRERDEALTEARMLEQLSTRDALTGLLNRRGLEARFDELIEDGFDTFALIDLDRFKQVNDIYGHQVGDAALVACAKALQGHESPDLVAARLGGEEFVVLLRGKRSVERAEALRTAIPIRIAADVEGLSALVTASSGVVEVPRASNTMLTFEALYARGDALLYEAKASGRNRMLYERLTIFERCPGKRSGQLSGKRSGQDRRQQDRRASDEGGPEAEVA